jgi:GntR family transcriptional regulator
LASFRLEPGPVPLHHQVYVDLRTALDDGDYRPGDLLPPERELAERYGCSLITVRRALSELAREQRIQRSPGRGTHVLAPRIERNLGGNLSFTQEMQARGLIPETKLVSSATEQADDRVADALLISIGAPVIYLERLRLASGEPLLLEQARLPADRFAGLLHADLERQSLYDVLAEQYDAPVFLVREALEPVLLRSREARLLKQPARAPALLVEGVAFSAEGTPIEFGRTYVRGDRTRYYVERTVARATGWPAKRGQRFELRPSRAMDEHRAVAAKR